MAQDNPQEVPPAMRLNLGKRRYRWRSLPPLNHTITVVPEVPEVPEVREVTVVVLCLCQPCNTTWSARGAGLLLVRLREVCAHDAPAQLQRRQRPIE